jgi:murein DD-endopeptidase MepM/ murein hydrolase activator NlpD
MDLQTFVGDTCLVYPTRYHKFEPAASSHCITTIRMKSLSYFKAIQFLAFLLLLTACGQTKPVLVTNKVTQVVKVYVTATLVPTSTPKPTFTPSPTPTQTAYPMTVSGEPRAAQLSAPVPQNGAPCGLVDTLDFPLKPPDGEGASGGGDFGTYRRRYEKYHTGEDWGFGSSNFGSPVYSIGHGQVTYAQPLGWGADQGVVIVEHILRDGSSLLSFYGHLDPPSVVLRAGDCVTRGDQVGVIGRPRTRPHLHFEIRTNMPNTPGPGYWPVDPTRAGWLPPSATISNYRISTSPGVRWIRPNESWSSQGLGVLDNGVFVAVEDQQLMGVSLETGELRWSHLITETLHSALLDVNQTMIYLAASPGMLQAFSVPALGAAGAPASSEALPEPDWQINLGRPSSSTVLPLPDGGVVAATRDQLSAVSVSGEILWEGEPIGSVVGWARSNEALIITTTDAQSPLWSVDETGAIPWDALFSGKPAVLGDQVFLYSEEGVYRLDADARSTELIYALPDGILKWGDIVPVDGKYLLVVHADADDRRLLALDPEGVLRWERSLGDLPSGPVQLMEVNNQAHLMVQQVTSSTNSVKLYAIDTDHAELTLIFKGGTRTPVSNPEATWAHTVNEETIVFNIGGGGLVAFNPQLALTTVWGTIDSP